MSEKSFACRSVITILFPHPRKNNNTTTTKTTLLYVNIFSLYPVLFFRGWLGGRFLFKMQKRNFHANDLGKESSFLAGCFLPLKSNQGWKLDRTSDFWSKKWIVNTFRKRFGAEFVISDEMELCSNQGGAWSFGTLPPRNDFAISFDTTFKAAENLI